jgi:hypothetical protein
MKTHNSTGRSASKSTGVFAARNSTTNRPYGKKKIEGWAWRLIEMLESPAYRALSLSARRVMDRLEIELGHHGLRDNGRLPVTYQNFKDYGMDRDAITFGIRECVALGFIEVTERGRAGNAEFRSPNLFRITYRKTDDRAGARDAWRRIQTSDQAKSLVQEVRSGGNPRREQKFPVTQTPTEAFPKKQHPNRGISHVSVGEDPIESEIFNQGNPDRKRQDPQLADGKKKIEGWGPRLIEMLESPAYRALSLSARRVMDRLEIELGHHGRRDNGRLPVTYQNFMDYGMDREAIPVGIRQCVALGFIEVTEKGRAGNAEFRSPNLFRLTYRETDDGAGPTDEWRRIQTGDQAKLLVQEVRSGGNPRREQKFPVTQTPTEAFPKKQNSNRGISHVSVGETQIESEIFARGNPDRKCQISQSGKPQRLSISPGGAPTNEGQPQQSASLPLAGSISAEPNREAIALDEQISRVSLIAVQPARKSPPARHAGVKAEAAPVEPLEPTRSAPELRVVAATPIGAPPAVVSKAPELLLQAWGAAPEDGRQLLQRLLALRADPEKIITSFANASYPKRDKLNRLTNKLLKMEHERARRAAILAGLGDGPNTQSELAAMAGMTLDVASKVLARMLRDVEITKTGHGIYTLPQQNSETAYMPTDAAIINALLALPDFRGNVGQLIEGTGIYRIRVYDNAKRMSARGGHLVRLTRGRGVKAVFELSTETIGKIRRGEPIRLGHKLLIFELPPARYPAHMESLG